MTSRRHFNGIAHDIAHHAQSGLSFLHPEIAEGCRRSAVAEVRLNLLSDQPWPPGFPVEQPLRLATAALQQKMREMAEAASLDISDLAEAYLIFCPAADKDDYSTEVRSRMATTDGRIFAHTIPITW